MNAICEVQGNRIANDIHYHLIQMWRELVGGWITKKDYQKRIFREIKRSQSNTLHILLGGLVLIALIR